MRIHPSVATALLLSAAACRKDADLDQRRAEASAGLGRCTIEEPAGLTATGQSVFYVDETRTTRASLGRYAVMLSCRTPGPAGRAVTLILPNLADSVPPAGRYRVLLPGTRGPSQAPGRLGWGDAQVPASEAGVAYHAVGGEIVLERSHAGTLVGSYLIALEGGATGSAPEHLVLGGAFAAPRNTLPLAAALARSGAR